LNGEQAEVSRPTEGIAKSGFILSQTQDQHSCAAADRSQPKYRSPLIDQGSGHEGCRVLPLAL